MLSDRTRHFLLVFAAAVWAGGAGCSYNPGYVPYTLPGGPIIQEHAKPRFGFFRDFDPKACRLDVTPRDATAPLGSQIVLVATVYDKDGQPRRSRRVEWILEGPGNIIEVDEAGLYAGRGYKVDNKYAVTYTDYIRHTITRGNNDPKDDVEISPGQTFCVISSAVPGETTVTAYAPGVFNWDNGRVVSKIVWGEGRFTFPPPAVVRYGGEHALTTSITHFEQDGPVSPNYRVRYRLLDSNDGTAAVLVSRNGAGTSGSQSGTTAKEVETVVDTSGAATVQLVQPTEHAGKTRVAVEIVKPSENGTGPGKVVSRRETVIQWVAPEVKLDVTAPPVAAANGSFPATVSVANTGLVDSGASQVRVSLSDGATLERSEPPPVRQESGALIFDLPAVAAGKKQEATLQVRPARVGQVTVTAEVATADKLQARKDATTKVETGRLAVLVEAPSSALAGEQAPIRIAVTNSGATPAASTTVWARFDSGLTHPSGQNPVEFAAGTLAPGQTKTFDLPLTGKTTGRYAVRANVAADGNLSATSAPVAVDVRRAELKVAVTGPRLAYMNESFPWTITVSNTGDGVVSDVVVRAMLPPEVRLKDAGTGTAGAGSVAWRIPELQPGAQQVLKLTMEGAKLTNRATLSVSAMADQAIGSAKPVQARGDGTVSIIGTPALGLELATPPGLIEIGKRTTYVVRVRNQGTVSARSVGVTAFAPPELKVVRATGAGEGRIDSTGQVTFPPLDDLQPGSVATFRIEVEPVQAGDARFRAEVQAGHLKNPLKEEQSARIVGGR